MAHQVAWTEKILKAFIDRAMLSDDEKFIMETRVKGKPVSYQAMELNVSEATVHRMIAKLKTKYDRVQKEYPEEFPKRRFSAKETWMDEN